MIDSYDQDIKEEEDSGFIKIIDFLSSVTATLTVIFVVALIITLW